MARALVAGRLVLLVVVVLLSAAQPASAGSYQVVGGCGNWTPHGGYPQLMTIYGVCPGLVVRHVGGPFWTPYATAESREFLAPAGATVGSVSMSGHLIGRQGWHAAVLAGGAVLAHCPGTTCPGGAKSYLLASRPLAARQLSLAVWCADLGSCPNGRGLLGLADAQHLSVEVQDPVMPIVNITGGTLLSGWRRGNGVISIRASDNVGIKLDRLLVDGVPREQRARSCRWGARIPCSNGATSLSLATTGLSDGPHTMTVQAIDAATMWPASRL